jgi:hypothetical protein
VVVAAVEEGALSSQDAAAASARQLAWHGIRAEPQSIKPDGRTVASPLFSAAENCGTELSGVEAYSTGRCDSRKATKRNSRLRLLT